MSLPLILGSSSKWRRAVLAQMLGLSGPHEITAMAADIDEKGANRLIPSTSVSMTHAFPLIDLVTFSMMY